MDYLPGSHDHISHQTGKVQSSSNIPLGWGYVSLLGGQTKNIWAKKIDLSLHPSFWMWWVTPEVLGHHFFILHPGRLTWNLQITHLERKMIFQTPMIVFHVNLRGCSWFMNHPLLSRKGLKPSSKRKHHFKWWLTSGVLGFEKPSNQKWLNLTWPMAKRLKLFGIIICSRDNKVQTSNFQGPLAKWD